MKIINQDIEKNNLFTRRAFLIASGKFGLLSTLLARLYYMEVIKSDEYKVLSDKNHINLLMVPPLRGHILDRQGKQIAINKSNYRLMLDKKESKDYITSVSSLFLLLNTPEEDAKFILQRIGKSSPRLPIQIFDHLSWQEVSLIEENIVNMPGIFIETGQVRFYPYNYITSHIIGHTGILNEEEKAEYELENIGDFHLGKRSIEKYYNSVLMGTFGVKKMEVNAHGLYIREIDATPAIPGEELELSINIDLQSFVASRLDKRGSAAVIMNVKNGEILSMVSTPGFEPNNFVQGVSKTYWNSLLQDENKPLINKAINGCYPPGSTFKLIVMLAALEAGLDPNHTVDCFGYTMVGNRKFRCASKDGHGKLNMRTAIQRSCNCYMYNVAKIIGVDKIINMASKMGIGQITNIDLPDESTGFLPNKKWKKRNLRQEWSLGDTMNTAIGQGYILTTPLQMANFAAAIANGGILYPPSIKKNTGRTGIDLAIPAKHLEVIREGMFMASNVPGGTAYRSRSYAEGFEIAGKTGTSQVVGKKSDSQNLSLDSTPWNRRNHGIFVGFGPFYDPTYACAVLVEHGGDGSKLAAPIGRDILIEAHKLL
jgi:penicillin-binding protein 2